MTAIRPTEARDLAAIGQVYAHHVINGVATFETDPPDAAMWQARWDAVRQNGLPFLTATLDGRVAGYAYCAPWKGRPAYRQTVESSIYLAPDSVGRGIGGALLDALLDECARSEVREVIAVVVDFDAEASLALHRSRGFREAGRLTGVGYKHRRWLDTVLLQRSLRPVSS